MSDNAQDLRTSLQILRRHRIIVGILVLLGVFAGFGYSALKPPMLTSNALVVLPSSVRNIATQAIIADSDAVLSAAAAKVEPALSLLVVQSSVKVVSLTANVISVTAHASTASRAEDLANAVAESYIAYVGSANNPAGLVQARILEPATSVTGGSRPIAVAVPAVLGALAGLLAGVVLALAMSRRDRRLRYRDDIADAIGVPVLASVGASLPSDPAGWARLLADYRPTAVEAWRLRSALNDLGLAEIMAGASTSVAVLSMSGDRRALAVGPQLASFAAGLGVPTTLVFGRQQVPDVAATLRVACVALATQARASGGLRVAVGDLDDAGGLPDSGLALVVGVVDGQSPGVGGTVRAAATVLAVSSGAATADQLARVASSTLTDGRSLVGIIVADPDPADRTTGRIPQLVRPAHQIAPRKVIGKSLEPRS